MNKQQLTWSAVKVGIVVLIGLIIFVFVISVVGTEQNMFTSTYNVKFFVPNIQGLVNGAMITLGGLKIGYVRDLQFVTRDGTNGVEITAVVLSKYHTTITNTSIAQIKTIGLLGDKYIDITIGAQGEEPVPENTFIPVAETFDFEAVLPQFKKSLTDFSEVLQSAKRIVSSIDKAEGSVGKLIKQPTVANQMERFLQSLNGVMAAIERQQGVIGSMVYGQALSKNVNDLTTNLKTVTDQLSAGKGTMGKLMMDDKLYNNLTSFTQRADSLLVKATSDTTTAGKLLNNGDFYRQLMQLMNDLNLLIVDLKQHPERYVKVSVF